MNLNRGLLALTLVAFGLALVMTVLSAHIRLQDSAVDCGAAAFCFPTGMSASPGITIGPDEINRGLRATHRLTASLFGILILLVFMISLWQKRARWVCALLLLLTVILALVGLNTPDPGHPIVTTVNLAGGMLLSALLLAHLRWMTGSVVVHGVSRPIVALACGLFFITILSGAWVSANFAAGSCESFFGCDSPASPDSTAMLAFDPGREIGPMAGMAENPLILWTHHVTSVIAVLALLTILTLELRGGRRHHALGYGIVLVGLIAPALWPAIAPLTSHTALIHNSLSLGALLMLVNSLFRKRDFS